MNSHIKTYNKIVSNMGQDWHDITDAESFSWLYPDMTQAQYDLLGAFRSLSSSMVPWSNCYVFENVVNAINNNIVDPEFETKPEIEDVMYAIYVMDGIRPGIPFSSDIGKYVAALAMDEGVIYLPQPADFANNYIKLSGFLVPIAKKISRLGVGGILDFKPEPHLDDDIYNVQASKLRDIMLAYRTKIDQSFVAIGRT